MENKKKEKLDVYKMKLHEWGETDPGTSVMRVPGGWIYHFFTGYDGGVSAFQEAVVFVPFSEEFKQNEVRK